MKKISLETLKDLAKREGGLSTQEVLSQRALYGNNEIVEVTGNPWIDLAVDTLKDPMIWFLVGIGSLFVFVGQTNDAVVLFSAILPLVFMDAFLHWRTQASTSSLKGQLATKVTVVRGQNEVEIESSELVPGDVIVITPGLYLPADGLFQSVTDLQIDESVLTGEAFPIQKRASGINPFSSVADISVHANTLGYAGTRVLTGVGRMRVLLTGQRTAYGEIIQSVSSLQHERTPLQKSITKLVQGLVLGAAFLCLLLAGVRIFQGHGWLDAFLSAATLAVAAIPEEFPVVFTFFLGVGVFRLAKRHALVRRAVSVENIGRVTQICTDKTGTITIGILQLTHIVPANGISEADALRAALAAANPDGSDPVDLAIREHAAEKGLSAQARFRTFPFSEVRKLETAIVREPNENFVAYIKGSPETILARSVLNAEERIAWDSRTAGLAREGHKVLACARKSLGSKVTSRDDEPASGYEFCGLLAFEDPPRPEVAEAMAYCKRNGIRVLMLTGDHPETAAAIAKEVGLGGSVPVVASAETEPEKFEEQWLDAHPEFLLALTVVARCTPLQKLRIVNALKHAGELVAVTGDGINDVPALKAADIGIAMGTRGTRSAKEVSSIVLADDNFRTIVDAIMEGKQLFSNLKMSFNYLLLFHIPFILTAALIPLLGYPLLYLPIHIVWLELIIHPSALFAFQERATGHEGKSKSFSELFTKVDTIVVLLIGIGMTALLSTVYISSLAEDPNIGRARAQVMAILIIWSAGLVCYYTRLKTKAAIAIVLLTTLSAVGLLEISKFAEVLHFSPLQYSDWILAVGSVCAFLLFLAALTKLMSSSEFFAGQSRVDKNV